MASMREIHDDRGENSEPLLGLPRIKLGSLNFEEDSGGLHVPRQLRPLFRYRHGWLVLLLAPVAFLFLVTTIINSKGRAPLEPDPLVTRSTDHLRLALKLINEEFPRNEDVRLPSGLYVPEIDPANVCIVQADNRPLATVYRPDQEAKELGATLANMEFPDATVRHNLLYALRHGYRYLRLDVQPIEGLHYTWWKIPAIIRAVEQCEYTVFLDSDAYFNKPQYSLKEILKRWGFHNKATFLQTPDPPDPDTAPLENYNTTNTGFWIIRQNEMAIKFLNDLVKCPFEIEGCNDWAYRWAHEQMAWTKYFRPKLREGMDLILAPCHEANGFWDPPWNAARNGKMCLGTLVSHVWSQKPAVPGRLEKLLAGEMTHLLQTYIDSSLSKGKEISIA